MGISERFALNPTTSPGALVCPIPLDRNVLYVFVSEDAHDRTLALTDKPTGVHIPLALPAERAAMAIVDGTKRRVVATYGF